MHPEVKYWDKTKQWYADASIQTCDIEDKRVSGREIVMIGDDFAEFCREFLQSLREATGLFDKPICETNEVMSVKEASSYSIVGHHNISSKKWDVIPCSEALYYGLDEEYNM